MKPIKTRIEYGESVYVVIAVYADGTEREAGRYKTEKEAEVCAYYCTFNSGVR